MLQWVSRTITGAILLSLLIHVSMWKGLDLMPVYRLSSMDDQIEVEILDAEEQKKILDQEKAKKQRQVVEQDPQRINEETPKDSKYLSRHDQAVTKETKATHHGDFTNAAQVGAQKRNPRQKSTQNRQSESQPEEGTISDLKKFTPDFNFAPRHDSAQTADQEGLASQTNDHLEGVEEGLQTILNTREFVYYSYYQRIRDKIRQYWEPKIREKVRKIFAAGRSLASSSDRVTKVIIVLNREGFLIRVQIVSESGIQDLDEAAVEAFRAAEPFPNPPDGIVDEDGTIRIRWDFILEASSYFRSPRAPYYFA